MSSTGSRTPSTERFSGATRRALTGTCAYIVFSQLKRVCYLFAQACEGWDQPRALRVSLLRDASGSARCSRRPLACRPTSQRGQNVATQRNFARISLRAPNALDSYRLFRRAKRRLGRHGTLPRRDFVAFGQKLEGV